MGTKSVRLDEEFYKRIKAHKRDDETFSDVIDRLTSEDSLLTFAGGYSADDAASHHNLLDRAERRASDKRRNRLRRQEPRTE